MNGRYGRYTIIPFETNSDSDGMKDESMLYILSLSGLFDHNAS
jgi:hypothetical protein